MGKDILVWSCGHADPTHSNERFSWLGEYIYDTKPDTIIDLGDGADMASLNSYDTRYPQAIISQNYGRDIEFYNDSQDRLRHKIRKNKKRMPQWIGFEGNHEHRIKKAIALDPRLEGSKYGISFSHLQTKDWFHEYHEYSNSAPSIYSYGGVDFAHYFSSGNYGTATSGTHHAYTLINNRHTSSVCGHSHKRSVYFKDMPGSIGLVVGCFKGHEEHWAGQANLEWWHGVVRLKDVDNGRFEPEFISLKELERAYGSTR